MYITDLVKLTSKAWSLTILALMHAETPGRQAALLAASGASRTAFAQSLRHLVDIGMIERNPGHGHPLRPEFRLTEYGVIGARLAHQIETVTRGQDSALLRRVWTLPILTSLQRPSYFNDLKRHLTPITDRALSQSLKSMEGRHWIERSVSDATRPPRSLYRVSNLGEDISRVAATAINCR